MVFKKGTSNGLSVSIPNGGQIPPIATDGIKIEWKKAQKNPKKKRTSEAIKRIIPYRCPRCTAIG